MNCHLEGLSVLVTRPLQQSDKLCELIEQAHGRPVRFPAMEVIATADTQAAQQHLAALTQAQLAIFVSRNAVNFAAPLLPEELPIALKIAAIGKATGEALTALGLPPDLMPAQGFDSEGLLKLPALQNMQGTNVLLIRGNGGRLLLQETLLQRGASVTIAEVYQRLVPKRNPANLIAGWSRMVDVVTVTSNEILDNLLTIMGSEGSELVRKTPLVVISRRTAEHAKSLGCRHIFAASSASDAGIMDALCEAKNF